MWRLPKREICAYRSECERNVILSPPANASQRSEPSTRNPCKSILSPIEVKSNRLAGLVRFDGIYDFNGKGGASSVRVTLEYNSEERPDTGIVCRLNTPTDLTAADFDATGVGTLTLKIM